MLSSLKVENFTAFSTAEFKFSPGLNVIIGANGTGKSHILKLAYSVTKTSYKQKAQNGQSKAFWQKIIADDLIHIFKPESLGRLARRQQGHNKARVVVKFEKLRAAQIDFSFSTRSSSEVLLEDTPDKFAPAAPIFIPTKELLSLFPGLRGLYQDYELAIDETYPDLCDRLDKPLIRGARLQTIAKVLNPLEDLAGGEIKNENGKFYLYQKEGGRLEIDLVAEGLRKVATLAFLLKNGALSDTTTLFWDEPEANLNPRLIKVLASIFMQLSDLGYQIILATHSLFLLKELHIISKNGLYKNAHVRFFGISSEAHGTSEVVGVDDLEELPYITSLEAELEQSDRFSAILEDTNANNN